MNYLIKLSGEYFSAQDSLTTEGKHLLHYIEKNHINAGYIVVGGGNRIRGVNSKFARNASDELGILSTLMNALILKKEMHALNIESTVFSHLNGFGNLYEPSLAIKENSQNKWVILATGLGRVGYVSTDLSAVIKSLELNVDVMIKITKAGGVFDSDPKKNDAAKLLPKLTYDDVLEKKLGIMDFSAICIAKENCLKMAILAQEDLHDFLNGATVGSLISG